MLRNKTENWKKNVFLRFQNWGFKIRVSKFSFKTDIEIPENWKAEFLVYFNRSTEFECTLLCCALKHTYPNNLLCCSVAGYTQSILALKKAIISRYCQILLLPARQCVSSCCQAILPNLARLGPVIKIKTNSMCSHVIFIVFLFK